MRPGTPCIRIGGKILAESEKAIQIRMETILDTPEETPTVQWFPLSQIDKIKHRLKSEETGDELWVSLWIMKQKGYDYE